MGSRISGATAGSSRASTTEMLTPTYWGSLAAVFVGILYTIVASVRSGPPAHVVAWENQSLSLPLFYGTLVYVFLFATRYYCAVCVNVYGGSRAAVLHWPKGRPRRLVFALLCLLVLLALSSVAAVIALGVAASLEICRLMAIISFLVFGGTWLLSYVDETKYGTVTTAFGLGDLGLVAMSWQALESVGGEATDVAVIRLFILTALLGAFVVVEFRRRFWNAFREQFLFLKTSLDH